MFINNDDGEIDEGVHKYIVSQQDKRKKVQTGYVRTMVNQSQSAQDKREIFSEEDFCNPEYHKFQLPEFSKQHHESLFESQNKKLQQQMAIFDQKTGRSSVSNASPIAAVTPGEEHIGTVNDGLPAFNGENI